MLRGISSNGRFVILHCNTDDDRQSDQVWNIEQNLDEPWITVPQASPISLLRDFPFSTDEITYLATIWQHNRCHVYDLESGALKGEYPCSEPFFALDGRLLDTTEEMVVKIDTRQVVAPNSDGRPGFFISEYVGPFVVNRTNCVGEAHCRVTGDLHSKIEMPPGNWLLAPISKDAKIWFCRGNLENGGNSDEYWLVDTSSDIRRTNDRLARDVYFSPDGRVVAYEDEPSWIDFLWNLWHSGNSKSLRLTRWAENEELATFRNVDHACFSPTGNLFAVVHSDNSIAVFEFPFRKPWGVIVGSAVGVAIFSWCIGWLWARIRARKTTVA